MPLWQPKLLFCKQRTWNVVQLLGVALFTKSQAARWTFGDGSWKEFRSVTPSPISAAEAITFQSSVKKLIVWTVEVQNWRENDGSLGRWVTYSLAASVTRWEASSHLDASRTRWAIVSFNSTVSLSRFQRLAFIDFFKQSCCVGSKYPIN